MHLTFVSSEGLEQSALAVIASSSSTESRPGSRSSSLKMMKSAEEGYFNGEGGGESGIDSESDNEFLVIDETSPLLLDLDPPGTTRLNYMGDGCGKKSNKSLLRFRIRNKKDQRLPWVIVFTALGMAAMVLVGFITMFQDTASVKVTTNIIDVENMTLVSFSADGAGATLNELVSKEN